MPRSTPATEKKKIPSQSELDFRSSTSECQQYFSHTMN